MKLSLLSAALLAFFPAVAPAITINIFSDVLKTTDINTPMPTSGIVLLTAATTGTFNGPSGTSFVTGDEVILGLWDLSAVGLDGAFADTTGDLSFSGLWDEGDALRLYWYPTLTTGSSGPSVGTPYGYYSDLLGLDGSDPWVTTGESTNLSLNFFTSDSLLAPGSNLPEAGLASHTVLAASPNPVPDTASTFALMALGMTSLGAARSFLRKSRKA